MYEEEKSPILASAEKKIAGGEPWTEEESRAIVERDARVLAADIRAQKEQDHNLYRRIKRSLGL